MRYSFGGTSSDLVYGTGSGNVAVLQPGLASQVLTDALLPADILTPLSVPIANSTVVMTPDSVPPEFLGPDGVKALWLSLPGGRRQRIYANVPSRVAAIEAGTAGAVTAQQLSDLSARVDAGDAATLASAEGYAEGVASGPVPVTSYLGAATAVVDVSVSRFVVLALKADVEITLTGAQTERVTEVEIIQRQDARGGWNPTYKNVAWPARVVPTWTTTPRGVDRIRLVSYDQGATWIGNVQLDIGFPGSAPTQPSAPYNVVPTRGNASVGLAWSAPINTGGSPVTAYVITGYIGDAPQAPVVTPTAGLTYTVPGLTNGTSYTFTVAARNGIGDSPPSAPSVSVIPATTAADVPLAPAAPTVTAGDRSALLSWAAPGNRGSAITSYRITPSIAGVSQTPIDTGSAATSFTVTGLTNGTSYTFTVAATNSVGTGTASPASAAVTPAGVPAAPTGVTAVAGNGSATVSWTAADASGGFVVTALPGGTTLAAGPSVRQARVLGLANGTAYTFSIHAVNDYGVGPESASSAPVTPTAAGVTRKPYVAGLIERSGQPIAANRDVISGVVVNVDWADIQPTSGGAINWSSVDADIASAVSFWSGFANFTGVRLRIFTGSGAPTWAKNLAGGPLTLQDPQGKRPDFTTCLWWITVVRNAIHAVYTSAAAKYESDARVLDISFGAVGCEFNEYPIRTMGTTANVNAYIAAGFNEALDRAATVAGIDLVAGLFPTTGISIWHSQAKQGINDGTVSTQPTPHDNRQYRDAQYTQDTIAYSRTKLGSRAVNGNNDIDSPRSDGKIEYQWVIDGGRPITHQTQGTNGIQDLAATIEWCIANGAHGVELPLGYEGPLNGHPAPSHAQLADWDARLKANRPVTGGTAPSNPNLLMRNQSTLETDTTGWAKRLSGPTLSRSTAQSAEGVASLSVAAVVAGDMSAGTDPGIAPVLRVSAGTTYTWAFFVRAATVGRTVRAQLRWYDSVGTATGGVSAGTDVVETTLGWTLVFVTAVAPAGAVEARGFAYFVGAAASETHYVDKALFRQGTDTTWISP